MKPTKGLMSKEFSLSYSFDIYFNDWAEDKKVHKIIATEDKVIVFFTF